MDRRTFTLGASAIAAAGAAGFATWRTCEAIDAPTPPGDLPAPAAAARAELTGLTFADGAFEAFARDLRTVPNPLLATRAFGLTVGGLMLLSCDFFQNGADERREIQYVALFHPYARPCYTPFHAA